METRTDWKAIDEHIRRLKRTAEALERAGRDVPAVARNTARILASVRMLEINVCDLTALEE